jgi:ribosomal protein S18 acetylase RimI-like enzyme
MRLNKRGRIQKPDELKIDQATTDLEIEAVRALFQEYADGLRVSLCFQGFATELAGLPGQYAPPRGRLLLASENGTAVGCVALRPLSKSVGEMKRLFVRPAFRGQGIARKLTDKIIAESRAIGFQSIRLDTLPAMSAATRLYHSLGFVPCVAYYDTPLQDTIFMELQLDGSGTGCEILRQEPRKGTL